MKMNITTNVESLPPIAIELLCRKNRPPVYSVEAVPEYIYDVLNNYIKLHMTCLDLVICSTDGVMTSLDFGYDSTHHLE